MDFMFWVWLGVLILTVLIEFVTMEIVSIWFTFGAIIPFIMAATNRVNWEVQVIVFVILSAIMIVALRKVTKNFLLKNSKERTNLDALVGKQVRMLERTDFETVGRVQVHDVVWSAVGLKNQVIEKGEVVEIVSIDGNKLVVKRVEQKQPDVKIVQENETTKVEKKKEEK